MHSLTLRVTTPNCTLHRWHSSASTQSGACGAGTVRTPRPARPLHAPRFPQGAPVWAEAAPGQCGRQEASKDSPPQRQRHLCARLTREPTNHSPQGGTSLSLRWTAACPASAPHRRRPGPPSSSEQPRLRPAPRLTLSAANMASLSLNSGNTCPGARRPRLWPGPHLSPPVCPGTSPRPHPQHLPPQTGLWEGSQGPTRPVQMLHTQVAPHGPLRLGEPAPLFQPVSPHLRRPVCPAPGPLTWRFLRDGGAQASLVLSQAQGQHTRAWSPGLFAPTS